MLSFICVNIRQLLDGSYTRVNLHVLVNDCKKLMDALYTLPQVSTELSIFII